MTEETQIQGLPGRPSEGGNEGEVVTPDTNAAGTLDQTYSGTVSQNEPGGFPWFIWVMYAAVFAGVWFLMIRPQRQRDKKMKELQAGISTNDNIVTSGGLFGKVTDVGEDCFIVEFGTNRGVRIPVLKADVVAVRSPKTTPQPKEEA